MLTRQMCEPRFRISYVIPRYGSRDEYVGSETQFAAAFATRAMVSRWLDRLADAWDGYDYDVRVEDLHPERDLANWGPAEPAALYDDDDLPF